VIYLLQNKHLLRTTSTCRHEYLSVEFFNALHILSLRLALLFPSLTALEIFNAATLPSGAGYEAFFYFFYTPRFARYNPFHVKMSAPQPSAGSAMSSTVKQHAVERAAMDTHIHLVDEAQRRSRDQVVAGSLADLTTSLLRHSKEREELDKKHNKGFADIYAKIQDQWQNITEQYQLTRSQVDMKADGMRRRHKDELEKARREDEAARTTTEGTQTTYESIQRPQVFRQVETEAVQLGKLSASPSISLSACQGSDSITR
jgi:hypothetical protein